MEVPTRRLRRKTSLGQAVVTVAIQLAAVAAVAAGGWLPDFLDAEELAPEDEDKRKQVYLVTLPHPVWSRAVTTYARRKSSLASKCSTSSSIPSQTPST